MAAAPPMKREIAQVVIVVLEAQNLDAELATADLYCVCDLSNSARGETATRRGHDPVWDKEFRMKVYEVEGERPLLKVALMKAKGENGEDELLGQAAVAIDGKWKDNEYDQWLDLKLNGRYTGQLFLEMTYYPATLPPAPVQRRPSKLDKRTGAPFRMPLPADNPSGRFNPTVRPRIQQMEGPASLPHPSGSSVRPPVPDKGVKAQDFIPRAQQPTTVQKPAALPLPGDPEPPEIPAFLRPGRQPAQPRPAEEIHPHPQQQPQQHSQPPGMHQQQQQQPWSQQQHGHPVSQDPPPHSAVPHSHAPPPHASPTPAPPFPVVHHSQSDPRLSTQQSTLAPHAPRQQAKSMPLAEIRHPPSLTATLAPHQQQWAQQQQQADGRRRWSGPAEQPGYASQVPPASVLGAMSNGSQQPSQVFTEAPLPYHGQPIPLHPSTPQIQVQTSEATFPVTIPQGPYLAEQTPPRHQQQIPGRTSPSPVFSQAPSHSPAFAAAPQHPQPHSSPSPVQPIRQVIPQAPYPQQVSPAPPADFNRRPSFVPPGAPLLIYLPPTSQPQQQLPHQQQLQLQQAPPRRSPSPDFGDSVPMPGSFDAPAPPRPPRTPLAPPLPPPPGSRSPSPPPTPPRRPRDHTPPRAASPIVQGRTKLEEYHRERERQRVEERERAQAEGRDTEDEDRFHDAELPPPVYTSKPPPTAAEKGKGPARPESRDSGPIASTSNTASAAASQVSSDFSSSRIHAGQAELVRRFQQEREDARMAVALARENEEREAAERKERERKADEEFARMMKEEQRMKEQREREDEQLAKRMAEEGSGEEEQRRARERADEELARSLAEAA